MTIQAPKKASQPKPTDLETRIAFLEATVLEVGALAIDSKDHFARARLLSRLSVLAQKDAKAREEAQQLELFNEGE